MHVFYSKVDWWVYLVLLATVSLCGYAVYTKLRGGMSLGVVTYIVIVVAIGMALPLWTVFGTRYEFDSKVFRVNSGPFTQTFDIANITGIFESSSLFAAPALSIDRLKISLSNGSSVVISPDQRDRFIAEVEQVLNRKVYVEVKN